MSTLTLRHPRPDWTAAVVETVKSVIAGIVEGHDLATRYRELSRLSDADLARLGLKRTDLPQAVLRGVKGL